MGSLEMKLTFGISTLYQNPKMKESIDSIRAQNIPETDYEILIIGPKQQDSGILIRLSNITSKINKIDDALSTCKIKSTGFPTNWSHL
jgi:hypothetical protein